MALLLDLTRLVSRLGKGPMTGIDRVEFAYLDHFVGLAVPVFGLVRSAIGCLVLDRSGMAALRDGRVNILRNDLIGRIANRHDPIRAKAEAGLRRLAIARCRRGNLAKVLSQILPAESVYFNTGHANLDQVCLSQVKVAAVKIVVLVHDTIPLDHPQFARPDTVEPFRRKMQAVSRYADLVIHSCNDVRCKTEAVFAQMGRVPAAVVANLGVSVAAATPLSFQPVAPYFVILGTIEPRKNHAMLLDVWENLTDLPHLYIIGSRGWSNEAVTARIDALPQGSPVTEITGLSDGGVTTLLQGAQALLFPSFAEGYGYPALEAAAHGTAVIASNLKVFRELLGDFAVYLEPSDSYSWLETIGQRAMKVPPTHDPKVPPTWAAHFNLVLTRV